MSKSQLKKALATAAAVLGVGLYLAFVFFGEFNAMEQETLKLMGAQPR